jgi:hypothetical protein
MNATMKKFQDFDLRQELARIGMQTMGNIVTVGVVVFLVLAWVFTVPFIQLSDQFAGNAKVKKENN